MTKHLRTGIFVISIIFVLLKSENGFSQVQTDLDKIKPITPNLTIPDQVNFKTYDLTGKNLSIDFKGTPAVVPTISNNSSTKPSSAKSMSPMQGALVQAASISSGQDILSNQFPYYDSPSVRIVPQYGSVVQSFPIEVPPGVNGIQPNISITYASSLRNGLLGVGWNFELGSIERSTKKGIPTYGTSDQFVLIQQGGAQELVNDSLKIYRPKIEGAFLKIEKDKPATNAWLVIDKSGTKFYYGQTVDTRISDPADANKIFKWCLDKVEDTLGNVMTITYTKDADNQIYPLRIDYTSNSTVSPALASFAKVEFTLGTTRFKSHTSYTAGFKIKTSQRIDKITIKADNQIQREYVIDYISSTATQRDLISSITQVGSNGILSLPPIKFTYYDEKGFSGENLAGDIEQLPFSYYPGFCNRITFDPANPTKNLQFL